MNKRRNRIIWNIANDIQASCKNICASFLGKGMEEKKRSITGNNSNHQKSKTSTL